MIRLEIEQTDNVVEVINKIKRISDLNIELIIPEESVILENSLNLKLIQHQADKLEKSIEFVTDDEIGNNLIASLTGKNVDTYIPEEFDKDQQFVESGKRKGMFSKLQFSIPKITLPAFVSSRKNFLAPLIIILTALASFIFYGSTAPRATARIKISSQPLARSVTIRVKSNSSTDVVSKILKGTVLSTNIEVSGEKETTGTKTVGEKAEGNITVYNNTTEEIKLEKGDGLTYEGKSTDLKYVLKNDVDVPPVSVDPVDPTKLIRGEATVKIVAADIGTSYNIDSGKSLVFSDFKKIELEGKTKENISGGKSEEVKIVSQEDLNNLLVTVKDLGIKKAEDSIKSKLGSSQKLITGSTETEIISESYSAKVGDEAAKVTLNQSVGAKALVYMESELNSFIDKYVEDVVPENFVLSSQDKEVKVEVLGKSTNSVLSSNEADIQVTLKAFVVPNIKEDEIKNSLKGKTDKQAQEIIGSIKNVNSYEFYIKPAIPFFKRTPNNIERIDAILVRE